MVATSLVIGLVPVMSPGAVQYEGALIGDGSPGADGFGSAVAVNENTLVIGAPEETRGASLARGVAYVYGRTAGGWSLQARLVPSDATRGDGFGSAVAISHQTIVIGAYGDDEGGIDSGAAFVYAGGSGTWGQQAVLKASNAEAGDLFGWSVAVSNREIVVGAYGEDSGDSDQVSNSCDGAGAAYVFSRAGSSWAQQAYLKASVPGVSDAFGWSVAISSNSLAVGAPR